MGGMAITPDNTIMALAEIFFPDASTAFAFVIWKQVTGSGTAG